MLNDLEKQIARELDNVIAEDEQTRGMVVGRWTGLIKDKLCEMAHRKGFRVSAAWCSKAETGEWLFELVWVEQKDNPQRFISMPLVMECEWSTSPDEIQRDFEKLLAAKSLQKLMVFQQATPEKVRNMMTILEDRIRHFQPKLPKERYLLAGYAYDQRVYVYESV